MQRTTGHSWTGQATKSSEDFIFFGIVNGISPVSPVVRCQIYLKDAVVEVEQLALGGGVEHAGDVFGTFIVVDAEQLTRPLQIVFLTEFGLSGEH